MTRHPTFELDRRSIRDCRELSDQLRQSTIELDSRAMTSGPLGPAVDDVRRRPSADELATLSGRPRGRRSQRDAVVEAANIVARRHRLPTGGSPRASSRATSTRLGHRLRPAAAACRRSQLRESGLLARPGRSVAAAERACSTCWCAPTPTAGTRRSHRYYELALRLAHVTAALDLVPSPAEIDAIAAFRTTMLAPPRRAGRGPARPAARRRLPPRRHGRSAAAADRPAPHRRARADAAGASVQVELPPARPIEEPARRARRSWSASPT